MDNSYKEYRKDGWPYCPQCEEDELYSVLLCGFREPRPTLDECLANEMRCYLCGWNNLPPIEEMVRRAIKDVISRAAPNASIMIPMEPTDAGKLLFQASREGKKFRTFRNPDGSLEHITEADDPNAEFPAEI